MAQPEAQGAPRPLRSELFETGPVAPVGPEIQARRDVGERNARTGARVPLLPAQWGAGAGALPSPCALHLDELEALVAARKAACGLLEGDSSPLLALALVGEPGFDAKRLALLSLTEAARRLMAAREGWQADQVPPIERALVVTHASRQVEWARAAATWLEPGQTGVWTSGTEAPQRRITFATYDQLGRMQRRDEAGLGSLEDAQRRGLAWYDAVVFDDASRYLVDAFQRGTINEGVARALLAASTQSKDKGPELHVEALNSVFNTGTGLMATRRAAVGLGVQLRWRAQERRCGLVLGLVEGALNLEAQELTRLLMCLTGRWPRRSDAPRHEFEHVDAQRLVRGRSARGDQSAGTLRAPPPAACVLQVSLSQEELRQVRAAAESLSKPTGLEQARLDFVNCTLVQRDRLTSLGRAVMLCVRHLLTEQPLTNLESSLAGLLQAEDDPLLRLVGDPPAVVRGRVVLLVGEERAQRCLVNALQGAAALGREMMAAVSDSEAQGAGAKALLVGSSTEDGRLVWGDTAVPMHAMEQALLNTPNLGVLVLQYRHVSRWLPRPCSLVGTVLALQPPLLAGPLLEAADRLRPALVLVCVAERGHDLYSLRNSVHAVRQARQVQGGWVAPLLLQLHDLLLQELKYGALLVRTAKDTARALAAGNDQQGRLETGVGGAAQHAVQKVVDCVAQLDCVAALAYDFMASWCMQRRRKLRARVQAVAVLLGRSVADLKAAMLAASEQTGATLAQTLQARAEELRRSPVGGPEALQHRMDYARTVRALRMVSVEVAGIPYLLDCLRNVSQLPLRPAPRGEGSQLVPRKTKSRMRRGGDDVFNRHFKKRTVDQMLSVEGGAAPSWPITGHLDTSSTLAGVWVGFPDRAKHPKEPGGALSVKEVRNRIRIWWDTLEANNSVTFRACIVFQNQGEALPPTWPPTEKTIQKSHLLSVTPKQRRQKKDAKSGEKTKRAKIKLPKLELPGAEAINDDSDLFQLAQTLKAWLKRLPNLPSMHMHDVTFEYYITAEEQSFSSVTFDWDSMTLVFDRSPWAECPFYLFQGFPESTIAPSRKDRVADHEEGDTSPVFFMQDPTLTALRDEYLGCTRFKRAEEPATQGVVQLPLPPALENAAAPESTAAALEVPEEPMLLEEEPAPPAAAAPQIPEQFAVLMEENDLPQQANTRTQRRPIVRRRAAPGH